MCIRDRSRMVTIGNVLTLVDYIHNVIYTENRCSGSILFINRNMVTDAFWISSLDEFASKRGFLS